MDRRKALKIVSALYGGVVIGSTAFLNGCSSGRKSPLSGLLNIEEKLLMDEIGETILPKTNNSPGAAELRIGTFINTVVSECYNPAEQELFMNGIVDFQDISNARYGRKFADLNMEARYAILQIVEEEARSYREEKGELHYYSMIKQLVVWAYLSSRQVSVEVLGYVQVPGRYDGCIPYKEGDKAVL